LNSIESLYRHEYGHLVAILTQRVGVQHLVLIQDSVQQAIEKAILKWTPNTTPSNPTGWLYLTAFRFFLSEQRTSKQKNHLLAQNPIFTDNQIEKLEEPPLKKELSDSLLRMLFLSCDDKIPAESQLVFTLKSLCGFSISAIATRLLISEENAYKRYGRAKLFLKQQHTSASILHNEPQPSRLASVLRVLYVLFTEGYLSSHPETAIRKDLCFEAIRLALLLSKSEWGNTPECTALIALMYFNIARIQARHDTLGLVLLADQDRSTWDQSSIYKALEYLNLSTKGNSISRYHVEAGIAATHCISPSFAATKWENIVKAYELLAQIAPSPLHTLNHAIATAEYRGAGAALILLKATNPPHWLSCSYHWYAVMSDLQYRNVQISEARENAAKALERTNSVHIEKLLHLRFERYEQALR